MGRTRKGGRIAALRRWVLKVLVSAVLLAAGLTVMEVVLLRYIDPPCTTSMAWRRVRGLLSSRGYNRLLYEWRDLEAISPHLRKAVLAGEDQRFPSHHGFDFVELGNAVRQAVRAGQVRGASTITMQAARTLFLWPDRTLLRKGLEAYYTVLMELFWDKRRILEVYLNTVDWGSGIMGAEAASRRYFGIGCHGVTPSQAALLAAILPNPHRWSPVRPGRRVLERQRRILRDMPHMPDV
ncbi:MAG: monofunctional biosynthetic peptidoglycan transglycosylase [Deltaproteobacteria bacterium]|nr:monofunctional biosynthetic peptidoglycan transglycosylase [Deltaproteobacteria bacterium]